MKKNESVLKVTDIESQKEKLETELSKVQDQLSNLEKAKVQLEYKSFAYSGAIQQCDLFLKMLSDASPASNIPSQDDNAAIKTALS